MRVLQVMAGARHGGAEMFFERLVCALNSTAIEQKVIIRKDTERLGRLCKGGVNATQLPFGGLLDLYTPLSLRCISNHFKPDVTLTWMNRATRMMPKAAGVKVARLGGFYDLKYYRDCDHLVGNTRGIVEYLIGGGWPQDKAHYLPNFVSVPDASPVERSEFSTPEDAPLLLSMGRLHTNKAFDVLIEAMPAVDGAYLWIVGEGPERLNLETLAYNKGVDDRVRFLGWRQDIGNLLTTSDIYVCPSRHEPLGNVVIEGWAARKPVVAAASQGPTELITNGQDGLLAMVDDPDALADALNTVVKDVGLRHRLAAAGHARYRQSFTQDVVVQQYLQFFNQITGKS